jgi:hypothetical protein
MTRARRVGTRALVAAATVALALLPGQIPVGAAVTPTAHPVIVIGSPGLRWNDLTARATPQLLSAVPDASLGALSVKAVDPVSCPDDGWLTLGAGNRVTAGDRHGSRCDGSVLPVVASAGGAEVLGLTAVARHNKGLTDGARVGSLAGTLDAAYSCVAAAGTGAALAAADPDGKVSHYLANPLAAASDLAFLAACPVTLITATPEDAGALTAAARTAAPAADIVIVGLAETGGTKAHLHAAIAWGPDFTRTRLVSASTRRAPFVQLVDVAPTILSLRGIDAPSSMIGEPWRSVGEPTSAVGTASKTRARVAGLVDLDRAAQHQESAIVPFFVVLVAFMLVASGLGWLVARLRSRGVRRSGLGAGHLCVASALVPAASFTANLVPWWRSQVPLLALVGLTLAGVVIGVVVVAILDAVIWRRRPIGQLGAVGLVTALVVGVDLLTGARLQIFTMAGYSPLVAGRFAGIGNVAFGVYAAGALLFIAALATQAPTSRGVIMVVASTGLITVAIDGGPSWGSDVGGVLALVPTLVLLAGWVAGIRISVRRFVLALVAAVAVVAVLGVVDYARPAAHQTHLGRFVGKTLHGGAWTILRRKGVADGRLLVHSPLTLLIPVLVIAAIVVIVRPVGLLRSAFAVEPTLRYALGGVLVMSLIGAAVNDSGVVIPTLAVLVVLPVAVAGVLRTTGRTRGVRPPSPVNPSQGMLG